MNLKRIAFTAALLLAAAGVSQAHDVKVLASRLQVAKPGAKSTIYLSWGHRLPVDELLNAVSIERYDLIGPDGAATPLTREGISLQTNVVELKEPGLYQVLVLRKASIMTYVIDEDGNRVLKRGPRSEIKEGKIDYAMRSVQTAKAILTVGDVKELVKPAGLPIEIVPLEPPARWASKASLHFQVLLQGKPLAGADLTATYIGFRPDDAACYATHTGRDGVATVVPAQAGTWVLRVNSKKLAQGDARTVYDYESFTTTLTIEIPH